MKKVVVFGASTSKKSINKSFATYAANKLTDMEVEVLDLNDFELPLFSVDLEEEIGIPENAHRFDAALAAADALIVSIAEHNGTYTAAFNNLVAWVSRINVKVWKSKPMLLLSTSPGKRGGKTVLEAAKQGIPYLGGVVVGDFSLPSYYETFVDGQIATTEFEAQLKEKVRQFEEHVQSL